VSKQHRIAWAAGFFDGEGYITIQVRGGKYKGHYLRIGVNHVDPRPLAEMQSLFGGEVRVQKKAPTGNRHRRHEWGISCKKAETALKQMLPYFHNKDSVAVLAVEFQGTMGTTQVVTEEVFNLRSSIKARIQEINAEG